MPDGATQTIAWVGKGIVYDTGGLSIKGKVRLFFIWRSDNNNNCRPWKKKTIGNMLIYWGIITSFIVILWIDDSFEANTDIL